MRAVSLLRTVEGEAKACDKISAESVQHGRHYIGLTSHTHAHFPDILISHVDFPAESSSTSPEQINQQERDENDLSNHACSQSVSQSVYHSMQSASGRGHGL